MVELELYRILIDDDEQNNTVILKEKSGDQFLPIFIGHAEAKAIELKALDESFDRPLTHDLFLNFFESLNIEVISVLLTKIVDSTFYAVINSRRCEGDTEVAIDARPSDALAIAIRTNCPIYCPSDLLEEASISLHN